MRFCIACTLHIHARRTADLIVRSNMFLFQVMSPYFKEITCLAYVNEGHHGVRENKTESISWMWNKNDKVLYGQIWM
jgi:hypothetical protein